MTQRDAVGREKKKEEDFGNKSAKPRINVQNTLAKWFIDSITVGTLLNTVAFYVVMGVLKGQSTDQIQQNVQTVGVKYTQYPVKLRSISMRTTNRIPITYSDQRLRNAAHIDETKVLTFLDLANHPIDRHGLQGMAACILNQFHLCPGRKANCLYQLCRYTLGSLHEYCCCKSLTSNTSNYVSLQYSVKVYNP